MWRAGRARTRDILPAEFLSTLNVERRTEAWRRVLECGPGSVLLATTTDPSLLVWVLEVNLEARRFYERLGGRLVAEKSIEIASRPIREVAYGWLEP